MELRSQTTRRTFLRSAAGATLALPWLESLAQAGNAPPRSAPTRLAFFYVPIGVVRRGFFPGEQDAKIPEFTSSQEEIEVAGKVSVGLHPLKSLTPTQEPLEPIKDKVTLITGMDRFYKHGSDVHAQCASCFLSSAKPDDVTSSVYPLARTLDHVIADTVGDMTPFRTLEFSCNSHRDNKESIYFDNISWYGTEHVAPSMRDPRKAYQRLFGTNQDENQQEITDLVLADARRMQRSLGRRDQEKFEEYFDGIRTLEQQLSKMEAMRNELSQVSLEEPPEAHLPRGEYIRWMGDLMIVALQTGLTNVATFMVGPERWDTPLMYESLFDKPMSHHQMSHNQQRFLAELLKIDRFHMEQFAYLVQRMADTPDVGGQSLLENTIFTYGSGLGDGATHQYTDLPIIVAGQGGGKLVTGQHLHCDNGTPLANLWLTIAQCLGVERQSFADSSGILNPIIAS